MIHPSTFSIAAFDKNEPSWGIAVASKFPAAGAVVPWARAGSGAIASQAFANTALGPQGLDLLQSGMNAEEVLAKLLESDEGRETRQVGIVDKDGNSATFTGGGCMNWAGGRKGPGYAIQGNILVSETVVANMEEKFLETGGDLAERLYAVLLAGDRAGGDRRGRQSAAIIVVKEKGGYGGFNDRMLDYRVDDDVDPVSKLGELINLHRLYFGKSPQEDRIQLEGKNLADMKIILNNLGYLTGNLSEKYDSNMQEALRSFVGNENFEERCDPAAGWIDAPVYHYLIGKFGK